jgi:hypothetical protein
MLASVLQTVDIGSAVGAIFFIVVIAVLVVVAARSWSNQRGVQRPMTDATSFPPPPPPDTVTVKCQYCGTQQVWKEACVKCGAPLPKPNLVGE